MFPAEKEWLPFVTEAATKKYMELREIQTGKEKARFELDEQSFVHPQLDLVVTHLKDEESFIKNYISQMEVAPLSQTGMKENQVIKKKNKIS